jgi:hypothetical protein
MNLFKKPQKNKISLQFQNVELKDGIVPVIKIKGKIPDGSLGNIDCENIFFRDFEHIQSPRIRL